MKYWDAYDVFSCIVVLIVVVCLGGLGWTVYDRTARAKQCSSYGGMYVKGVCYEIERIIPMPDEGEDYE